MAFAIMDNPMRCKTLSAADNRNKVITMSCPNSNGFVATPAALMEKGEIQIQSLERGFNIQYLFGSPVAYLLN